MMSRKQKQKRYSSRFDRIKNTASQAEVLKPAVKTAGFYLYAD
jgi:hypothetical protein